ncbi:MAG: hemerythrin domain-containing protein [Candidatus Sericytochromatia bacterium]|nr:hemerythrin domain-containing protein [Candidatus Sericytochromatia bacterium]
MDIFDTIREDHEKILGLLDSLEGIDPADVARQEQMRDHLIALLEAHTHAEEALFYPLLANDDGGRPLMVMATEQHHVVSLLVEELRHLPASDEHFAAKCAVLAENLEDHIEEEEEDIFPIAEELIDEERAKALGQQFQQHVNDALAPQRKAA